MCSLEASLDFQIGDSNAELEFASSVSKLVNHTDFKRNRLIVLIVHRHRLRPDRLTYQS